MGIWTDLKAKFSGSDFKGPGLQTDAETALIENDSGIMKSYIPNFLYKPPFGYPRPFNAQLIRKLAKNGYVFSVVQTLADEISSKEWDIVVKEGHEGEISDEEMSNIRKWFYNPNPENESFSQLLKKMVTDILEVDAGVWVKVFNRGGEFTSIYARDGVTFLANPDPYGSIAHRADYIPRNNVFYATFNSLTNANEKDSPETKKFNSTFGEAAAWYQYGWTMGAYPVPFGKREIVYVMRNPRTDSLYGRAPLEVLGEILYTLLYGSSYNLDFYLNNNMPEGIIQLVGANQETIKAFRERWERQFKKKDSFDNMRKQFFKYPVVNNDAKFTPFQLKPLEMEVIQQQEWFIKLFWACYGITSDEMGFTQDSNKASANAQNVVVKRKVIAPLLKLIQYHINTQIIPEFGIEGIEFRFDEYDLEEDLKKHQLYQLQIGMGIKTPEMVAEDLGVDIEKLKKSKEEKRQQDMEMMQAKGPIPFDDKSPEQKKGIDEKEPKKPEVKDVPRDKEAFSDIEDYIKEVGEKLIDAIDIEKRPLKKI